jgi:prepilin signal peptidase PulO-like enzyme (type II secretory pathway)
MEVLILILLFVFGLVFGSFFNVVIYRLPRKLSLVKPGSSCPQCGHALSPGELIPVVSFLVQGGKCRECGKSISCRYPLIELVTAVGFVVIGSGSSALGELFAGLVFFSLLLLLGLIDLQHKVLPNALTLPGVVLGLFFALLGLTIPFSQSLFGAAVGFGLIFLIALVSRGGMGMGDVKMMAFIGAFLGWKGVLYVLFGAAALTSIGGIVYLYLTKQDRKTPIPFGPGLAAAALIVYLVL